MVEDQLVTIARFENSFDANLAKMTLDNAGIQSVLLGEHLVANITYGIPSVAVELQVRQRDAVPAIRLLQEEKETLTGEQ